MNITEILTLLGSMMLLGALPSSSVALVVTRSAILGVINGIAVTLGIICGDIVFILLAVYGLTILAETMGSFFMIIKYMGAAYLLWLGYTLIASQSASLVSTKAQATKQNLLTSFVAGFVLTLGDIKAIVFYASLLPAFINVSTLSIFDIVMLILVMILGLGSVKVFYALSAARLVKYAEKKRLNDSANKIAGTLMIGTGGYLLIKS